MKFMSFVYDGEAGYGVFDEQNKKIWHLRQLEKKFTGKSLLPSTLTEAIAMGNEFISIAKKLIQQAKENNVEIHSLDLQVVELLAPIPRPTKNIVCVGKNYREHAIELGSEADIPEHLMVFTKAPTSIIGHKQQVSLHQDITKALDYEGELVLIIGKKGKNIKEENALSHVFGYTIMNDITARDLQMRHKQFFIGKSLDTSCPMGPWIVHHSAIAKPDQLDIVTKVNGEIRQQSNTKHFIFSIEHIISTLSQGMTLEPGDIIATGTPAGVGQGFEPPKYLKAGDTVEITIQDIGTLTNTIV